MFARQLNQIRLDVSLTPKGPLLIRSGRKGTDPSRPDLECVRTSFGGEPTVYVPGSSLKGVMRAHAERLLNTERLKITPTFDKAAQRKFKQGDPGDAVFRGSCPLGRTFGTLHVKGRLSVGDLLPGAHDAPKSDARRRLVESANATEQRNGVGIDRLLGSAKGGALFDQEVVVGGRFDGRILMRNVQLYQLALVLLVLADLDQGFVQLGSSTTRGCGFVGAEVRSLRIESLAGRVPADRLAGVGALGEDLGSYDPFPGDSVALPEGLAAERRLLWDCVEAKGPDDVAALADALMADGGPWADFVQAARVRTWVA